MLGAAAGGAMLRWFAAGDRALHTDEAVNALVLAQGWEEGAAGYSYDIEDRHGPTLLLAARLLLGLAGVTDADEITGPCVRLLPSVAGGALAGCLAFALPGLTRPERILASLFAACAAPLVYYGGTFIHETLLVAAGVVFAGALLRTLERPTCGGCAGAGAAAGAMLATKITAVLMFGSALVATLVTTAAAGRLGAVRRVRAWHAGVAGLAAVAAYLALITSLGTHPRAAFAMIDSLGRVALRAGGEGHEKPWWTFAAWFLVPGVDGIPAPGSALLLLAAAGAVVAWRRRRQAPALLWWTVFGGVLWWIHAVIPYKTPWLVLAVFAAACVPAAVCLLALLQAAKIRRTWIVCGVSAGVVAAASWEAWYWTSLRGLDPANPLAYSPTSPDIVRLDAWMRAVLGSGREAHIVVVGDDIWPLPWYLRAWPTVGYWPRLPEGTRGDAVIVTGAALADAGAKLGPGWRVEYFGLRDGLVAGVFVEVGESTGHP